MTDKARILFVDDEKRVLNAMRGLFRRDYELFLTCEGAEAVKIATENDIDVIVADQRMPGLTGIEVLGQVKKKSPRTVRILLTGYADPSAVEGSINIGEVFRFLSKPCPPKMLRETLNLAVAASRTAPVPKEPAVPEVATPGPTPAPQQVPTNAPSPTPTAPPVEPINADENTHPALPTLDESAVEAQGDSPHWHSVTNVVMSEDTVEETQERRALPATAAPSAPTATDTGGNVKDVGIVIFTVDPDFASTAIRSISSGRNTVLATTLVKVAHALEEQRAGVLVTDFTTNNTILQKMIGALKKYMPELVTIVASNGRDTTDMINLINYGQVFRYVLKPIEPEQLKGDINAAVIQHLYLTNNPESAKRHEVIDTPDETGSSNTMSQFLNKLRRPRLRASDPTDTIA